MLLRALLTMLRCSSAISPFVDPGTVPALFHPGPIDCLYIFTTKLNLLPVI